jgi:anti-sigma-K factor RskA
MCQQVQELLPLYAVGQLTDDELVTLRAHLATGCPACAGQLAELQAAAAHLPLGLNTVAPAGAVRQRFLERLNEQPPAVAGRIPVETATQDRAGYAASSLWKYAAAIIVSLSAWAVVAMELGNRENKLQIAKDEQIHALQQKLASVDTAYAQLVRDAKFTESMLKEPQWRIATVDSKDPAHPEAFGRICYDTTNGIAHFYAMNMPSPGAGKTYELWLITKSGQKVPVGTFDPKDQQGEVVNLKVKMPADAGPVMLAAVTDEPAGGVAQPTGTIRMAGALQEIH